MKKTIFLSESQNISRDGIPCMATPYIFFDGHKWREDKWYFLSLDEIKTKARKQGYLIK